MPTTFAIESFSAINLKVRTTLTAGIDLAPERWPQVAYAGPWCEARFAAGQTPRMADMFRVLEAKGRGDDKMLCAFVGTADAVGVVPLLERCWPSVKRVAAQLIRNGEIRHEDVWQALCLTDGGGPDSFELALIRSGQAPGSSP